MSVSLLLDANLSWRSAAALSPPYGKCVHVDSIGLPAMAEDIEIWQYAKDNDFIIVTNDDDFFNLLITRGFPPKIILLRGYNQSRRYIENLLIQNQKNIEEFSTSNETGLLEILK